MSTITQTTVVFSCLKCSLNYKATQEHSSDQRLYPQDAAAFSLRLQRQLYKLRTNPGVSL
jgi:hypothetical protein